MRSLRLSSLSFLVWLAWFGSQTAGAEEVPGVDPDRIVFGQSAAFKGPAAALGLSMRDGILAAFRSVNEGGGVHGRRLELISYDDGYEPDEAIQNVKRLIHEDGVFALIGNVGTPTSKAVQPMATRAGVPFVGPFTGAEFLRKPYNPQVVNVRASYYQETDAMLDYLIDTRGHDRIGIVYQDDSYGRAVLSGVQQALSRRGLKLVSEGTYKRNTIAVKTAVLAVRKGRPEAVIIVGAPKPAAEFIRVATQVGMRPLFLSVSFVDSKALAKELGRRARGVIVSQVMPPPEDTNIPLVAEYQRDLRAANPAAEPGFVSLEGYVVGRFMVEALRRIGPAVTREALIDAVTNAEGFDLGGLELAFGPEDNQGLDDVFFTELQADGSARLVRVDAR